ncbi:MAG TPA: hypothetical protein VND96_04205 [Candidatus Micrarchaeaceae archaeon]|nr:hypothetical protein [Candidatus Micrarchaeaceae archaeon]
MRNLTGALVLLFLLNACWGGPVSHPAPSVAQIGSDLNCPSGDHGFEDGQAGWGFCYPATWQYLERVANPVDAGPTHLDILLSITDVPCVPASPVAGVAPAPVCQPNAGLFGLMVISTYDRAGATDLASWMQTNLKPVPVGQAIQWGNATEADRLTDGRRIALTPHHVVVMELRFNKDGLDLEALMSTRLNTWKFLY